MNQEIEYRGFEIRIENDEYPENPFEAWDCEPPLMAFYGGRHSHFKTYQGAPEDLRDAIRLLPASCFERGKRVELARAFDIGTLKGIAEAMQYEGEDFKGAFMLLMVERYGNEPEGWRNANDWFDTVETLLKWAGITCHSGQSNGYYQGDSSLVLALATPGWIEKTGVQPENVEAACKAAFDLYSAWAWGDVYGIAEIISPEGQTIEDGAVWGFYGTDHEASGLMGHARATIDSFIKEQEAEVETLASALCTFE